MKTETFKKIQPSMFGSVEKNIFPDWQPLSRSTSFPRVLIWSFVFLVAVKLVLTSQEEIIAFYLPHDDLWQVKSALRAYWGGKGEGSKLYHPPIFPLFIEFNRLFGLPLRFTLEAFYCSAACFLTATLWRVGVPVVVLMLAAVMLIFHPASFQLPNRCGAEILLAPLLMMAIASTFRWWIVRRENNAWRYAAYAGIWWAFTWNVRKENIVLLPVFILLLLAVMVADRRTGWSRAVGGIILMLSFCLVMESTIKFANWSRWGLFATSVHTAPGFKSAIKALQSIRPDPSLAYIPVPVEVRRRAYAVSPAFAKLEPYLEGDLGRGWAVHSKAYTDAKGLVGLEPNEISAGWFYWAIYDAVVAAGQGSDPGETDRFLAHVGEEVRAAISDGRLPGRWVPLAMMDPDWSGWLPRLSESLYRVGSTFIKPAVPERPPYDHAVEEACGPDFDKAANRRSSLTARRFSRGEISGWATALPAQVQFVEIRSPGGTSLGRAPLDILRPDVDKSRAAGFQIPLVIPSSAAWQQAEVNIKLVDGREAQRPLSQFPIAQVVPIPTGDAVVHFAIDNIRPPEFKANRLWKSQLRIEAWFLSLQSWLLWPSIFAVMAIVVVAFGQRRPVDLVIVFLVVIITSRLLFFAVLDASAWPGDQPRYLYAVYPLFSLALVLVLARSLSFACLLAKVVPAEQIKDIRS